ncbi:helix-turn-helix transcriptional regulator [Flavobacterium tistrianum]|uniref:helix-turn-helix transcriptional regulator n=1 Tax=Flavobacterium tistrianum TaxID=1685414 RepID=UPI000DAD29A0|nr:helix-turn-helix transcriptional regulator [Flavobacterium tistrianum]KAF2342919.1 helix-turn-helix transcriptional regulator [Flavobacterium tistrianum]
MEFQYFLPSEILKPYIKHYYIFESDSDIEFQDTVFPSGEMEMIFNLGDGIWESLIDEKFHKTPKIELWGQITKPLAIKSKGRHTMLGIRFYTHSAAYFFNDEVGIFNDQILDLEDVIGKPITTLHLQLLETPEIQKRIELIESFLIKKLITNDNKSQKIQKVAHILSSLVQNPSGNDINTIAAKYGMTPRYLHKLVFQHTGLAPKSFNKITRFQRSLKLISNNDSPLTSVAYDSGYFDQSHFIRDFKAFTGTTPTSYLENLSPINNLII